MDLKQFITDMAFSGEIPTQMGDYKTPDVMIRVGKLDFPVKKVWMRMDNVVVIEAGTFSNVPVIEKD